MEIMIKKLVKGLLKTVYCLFILFLMLYVLSWHLWIVWDIILEFLLFCFLCAPFVPPENTVPVHKNVDEMTRLEFERYCAEWLIYRDFYKVQITPPSNDYGADLVAYDKQGHKWVFQCKRFKNKVGNKAVQEVVAAKAHYQAEYAAVITNSELTKAARQLAKENNIVLYEKVR